MKNDLIGVQNFELLHSRHSIRLKGYDYSQAGAYFVTVCTQDRACLLSKIEDGKLILNDIGQIVQRVWNELPTKYPCVEIDQFIVMPNHIHGIIVLSVGAGPSACPDIIIGQPQGVAPTISLPDVVHRFKSFTTTKCRNSVKHNNWSLFPRKLWQRNYYEHIIRNEDELNRIREYIINNPSKWQLDRENPLSVNYNLDLDQYFERIYEQK